MCPQIAVGWHRRRIVHPDRSIEAATCFTRFLDWVPALHARGRSAAIARSVIAVPVMRGSKRY
jgi:hypothetical protein